MLPYLILGVALLAGLLLAGRWYAAADPRTLIKALKWGLIGLVAAVALFFVATGRLGWAIATLPALVPWFLRARSVARMAKTFSRMAQAGTASAQTGETSQVETRFLRMELDHDSGRMGGEVIAGNYAGRDVGSLAFDDLISLLNECWGDDEESARLVEAYLDREHPDWRERAQSGQTNNGAGGGGGAMDRAEALQILGLAEGASDTDIKEAHRRLIAGMHPDHGGSDYLAAQINRAKDILLGD
ncbi:MAG: molecular chaperone DnaJ [Rhodospirillaceae bacterium]|nr:molecular chaperone DnaJ [Rhodospirillaceae bacterium]